MQGQNYDKDIAILVAYAESTKSELIRDGMNRFINFLLSLDNEFVE